MAAQSAYLTRGVVIIPQDLSLAGWPALAAQSDLNTIALHTHGLPSQVREFVDSQAGRQFLRQVEAAGLEIEYELHAMRELLPRQAFDHHPDWFRMNEEGERVPDCNLCPSSEEALEVVAGKAVVLGAALAPSTLRYHLWPDDAAPWCHCPACKDYSESDQCLIVTNGIATALRELYSEAQAAHLCYANTLPPPTRVKPEAGVFLEFAPISRCYQHSIGDPTCTENRAQAELLDENLTLFDRENAMVLEYWLDVSHFPSRLAKALPVRAEVVQRDLEYYASQGIRHVTTFAVFLGADYAATFGVEPVREYGRLAAGTVTGA